MKTGKQIRTSFSSRSMAVSQYWASCLP